MAALNFPEATANGQVFEADTGVVYTYIGTPPNGYWSGFAQDAGTDSLNALYVEKNDKGTRQTITGGGGLDLAGTIQLNSLNGSATFTKNVQVGESPLSGAAVGTLIRPNNVVLTADDFNGKPVNSFAVNKLGDDVFNYLVQNDGSVFINPDSLDENSFPVDSKIKLSSSGSAEFSDYIWCKTYEPNRIFIGTGTGGKQYAFYSTAGDGSTVNIGLGLDGTGTFAGDLTAGKGANFFGTAGGAIRRLNTTIDDGNILCQFDASTSDDVSDAVRAVTIHTNGTTDFGAIDIAKNEGRGCEVRADGLIRAQRPTGSSGSAVFQAWNGNFNSAFITAGGSATFTGKVVSKSSLLSTDGDINVAELDTHGLYVRSNTGPFLLGEDVSANQKVIINADGSAEFAGTVASGSNWIVDPSKQGCTLFPSGQANHYFQSSTNQVFWTWYTDLGGTRQEKITFRTTGQANFKGDLTFPNAFLILEPDNSDNYTTTTEEYTETETYTGPLGNTLERDVTKTREIRTYTGPTLNVKERLQNLISRMDALEADEITDDATSNNLLTLIASLTARVDARDAVIADLTARIQTLESA